MPVIDSVVPKGLGPPTPVGPASRVPHFELRLELPTAPPIPECVLRMVPGRLVSLPDFLTRS